MYQFDIKPRQYELRIYDSAKGESAAGRTNYTTSMLIDDLGMRECRLSLAHGELSNEINVGIIKALKALEFEQAQLEVPAGTKATRHATFVRTCDGLDRYIFEVK